MDAFVVGTDGSPGAEAAIRKLIELAGGSGASVHLVSAYPGKSTLERLGMTARQDTIDMRGVAMDVLARDERRFTEAGFTVEKHAREGRADPKRFPFPMPQFKDESIDFSYSGIKAGAIRLAREHQVSATGDPRVLADFCATFQKALFDQLFERLEVVWPRLGAPMPADLAVAGGVAANGVLRERMLAWGAARGVTVRLPDKRYCTDNAAMIAFAAMQRTGGAGDPRRVTARSRIA